MNWKKNELDTQKKTTNRYSNLPKFIFDDVLK